MHHPVLLLFLLLLVFLLAPVIGQALGSLGAALGPMLLAAPGGLWLSKMTAPMLFAVILLFGVAVVGLLKLVAGF